ncbi:MAG: hypothetical protein V2I47_12695 [Bacteroidales bacterium]|nr:hypothetical protein [Bacteroidales bacterium]
MAENAYDRFHLKNGGRFDYWVVNHASVYKVIEKYGLKPIGREFLFKGIDEEMLGQVKNLEARVLWPYPWPFPFPGGMRYPHLHFKDDIYILNVDQWKEFTNMVINQMKEKLEKAGNISYNDLMGITETLGPIA